MNLQLSPHLLMQKLKWEKYAKVGCTWATAVLWPTQYLHRYDYSPFKNYYILLGFSKVRSFWEGHKIVKNLPLEKLTYFVPISKSLNFKLNHFWKVFMYESIILLTFYFQLFWFLFVCIQVCTLIRMTISKSRPFLINFK